MIWLSTVFFLFKGLHRIHGENVQHETFEEKLFLRRHGSLQVTCLVSSTKYNSISLSKRSVLVKQITDCLVSSTEHNSMSLSKWSVLVKWITTCLVSLTKLNLFVITKRSVLQGRLGGRGHGLGLFVRFWRHGLGPQEPEKQRPQRPFLCW